AADAPRRPVAERGRRTSARAGRRPLGLAVQRWPRCGARGGGPDSGQPRSRNSLMLRRLLVLSLPAVLIVMIVGALWLTFKGFAPADTATEQALQQPRYEMENAQWLRYG